VSRKILCLDFDGVIHRYTTPWSGATIIADPPTEGALVALLNYADHFEVHVYSSRSNSPGGREAMQSWLERWMMDDMQFSRGEAEGFVRNTLKWPSEKPPAFLTIDDRCVCFDGTWPGADELREFRPWNRRRGGL